MSIVRRMKKTNFCVEWHFAFCFVFDFTRFRFESYESRERTFFHHERKKIEVNNEATEEEELGVATTLE